MQSFSAYNDEEILLVNGQRCIMYEHGLYGNNACLPGVACLQRGKEMETSFSLTIQPQSRLGNMVHLCVPIMYINESFVAWHYQSLVSVFQFAF